MFVGFSTLDEGRRSQIVEPAGEAFLRAVTVMARLRAPGGCPWDAEQTYGSLSQYILEEAYETFDAIQHAEKTGDIEHLKEELGDLLLQRGVGTRQHAAVTILPPSTNAISLTPSKQVWSSKRLCSL